MLQKINRETVTRDTKKEIGWIQVVNMNRATHTQRYQLDTKQVTAPVTLDFEDFVVNGPARMLQKAPSLYTTADEFLTAS